MKKEPLYVTMGVNVGSKEDPIEDSRIKEAKNVAARNQHPHVREANNARQQTQSKMRKKEAKSVQIPQATIARKVDESKYVGVCKRFLPRDTTTRKANSVQDANSEESADLASSSSSNKIEWKQNGQDTVHLLTANGVSKDCDTAQRNGQSNNKEQMNDNITNCFHHLRTEVKGSSVSKVSLFNPGGGVSDAEMKRKSALV